MRTARGLRETAAAALLAVGFLLLAAGCAEEETIPPPGPRTELVVLTRNAPTTYYVDREGHLAGLEFELATGFARAANLRVRFQVLDSIEAILQAIEEGRGDIAAAGLTRTESRAVRFLTGPEYQEIRELVVCGKEVEADLVEDLAGLEIKIIGASSYEETLDLLQESVPDLTWETTNQESTEELLQEVWEGGLDCTLADSNIVAVDRRFLPELETPMELGEVGHLAWLVANDSSELMPELRSWFEEIQTSGELDALIHKYYGHLDRFEVSNSPRFFELMVTRLPRYLDIFLAAEEETGLPWTLLAAVAYQESHWDPEAVSPTGVRGLMMLTQATATWLAVEDRRDPEASIRGGSRYLRQLLDRVPPFVPEPDRLWMALAAYNVGFGHLQDARMLAVRLHENPNAWSGVERVLPRLSWSRYYQELRHGYARGHEPVIYVRQVRNYWDLLARVFERPENIEPPPPADPAG